MFRYGAALVLIAASQCASQGADLQQLRDRLRSPEAAVRLQALQEVSKLANDPEEPEYRKLLFLALEDTNDDVRLEAVSGVSTLKPTLIRGAVPALCRLLRDKDNKIRYTAIEALAAAEPPAKDAVPDLLRIVDDADPTIRARSVRALGCIHADPDKVVPVLIRALKDPDTSADAAKKKLSCSVPVAAADALAKYETAAAEAVPALIEASKSSDRSLATFAVSALGYIKSKPDIVLPFLLQLLNDSNCAYNIRANAARSIGRFRGEAKHAVPDLLKAMKCEGIKDPDQMQSIRCSALFAFGLMGTDAKDAIPTVLELFLDKDQDSTVRLNAIQALAKIAPGSKEAVPPLIKALPKQEFVVYWHQISDALVAIGEPSVEPLTQMVADTMEAKDGTSEGWVCLAAIQTLGKFGPKAKPALPVLYAATEAANSRIQVAAKKAMEQIEKK